MYPSTPPLLFGVEPLEQVQHVPGIRDPFLNFCPINPPLKWSLAAAQFPIPFPVISDLSAVLVDGLPN